MHNSQLLYLGSCVGPSNCAQRQPHESLANLGWVEYNGMLQFYIPLTLLSYLVRPMDGHRDYRRLHRFESLDVVCSLHHSTQHVHEKENILGNYLFLQTYVSIFSCLVSWLTFSVIPFIVLRLVNLSPSVHDDRELPSIAASICTELVVNAALISSVVTVGKAFLRAYDPSFMTHVAQANDLSGGIKNSRGDTYYMLSATRSNNDHNISALASRSSEPGTRQSVSSTQPTFRPGHKSRATIESKKHNNTPCLDPSQMTISMTKEYDVAVYESGVRLDKEEALEFHTQQCTKF